jgi:AcrR family transcriptional regulator
MTQFEDNTLPVAPAAEEIKRPRRRSAESQALLRQEMIAKAKAIFLAKGYEAVSVRAVTQACGISTMSFYSYFDSKRDLAQHILADFFQAMFTELETAGEGHHAPEDVLEAHVRTCLDHCERTPDFYRMAFGPQGEGQAEPPLRFDDVPVYERLVALGRERLAACVRAAGRELHECGVALLHDLMLAKTLGYLCLAIVANRRAHTDLGDLRSALVRDIVLMARHPGVVAA